MNSPLVNNAYYHVFNRGVEKRVIFDSNGDYNRFLQTINFYRLYPTPRKLSTHLDFNFPPIPKNFEQEPLVKILCFCLMPNHFHLLLQQLQDGGVSEFMRRLADSFTRYFNVKNDRVGALFQGKFKAKIVETDEYLLQVSKYIHRNPLKLSGDKRELREYKFSSYPGYLSENIMNKSFYDTDTIKSYFSDKYKSLSYLTFVEGGDATGLPEDLIID